eukprot:gene3699-6513_t
MEEVKIKTPEANPFKPVHKWSTYEAIKTYILGPILVPIRLVIMGVLMFILNMLCRLSIMFWNPEKIDGKLPPLPWYRRAIVFVALPLFRSILAIMGIWWIDVKGELVSREETPIVIANHGTPFDGFVMNWLLFSSPIMRAESADNPILGPLYKAVQAIFVKRTTKESRKQVVEEICHRATTPGYPYLLIFPEGTTCNGTAIITLKNGAFYAGKPIQPVLMRFPNQHWDPHWTPDVVEWKLLLRALCQFRTYCEVEYLPPYKPNEEEKKNPTLFASNVQKYMAKHFGVPATTHSFQDALLLTFSTKYYEELELNFTIHDMIQQYGLKFEKDENDFEELLKVFASIDKNRDGKIDFDEFKNAVIKLSKYTETSQKKLQNDDYIKKLFKLMDIGENNSIDFKEFIMGVKMLDRKGVISKKDDLSHVKFAFTVFDLNADEEINFEEFQIVLQLANPEKDFKTISQESDKYFEGIDKKGMSFKEFQTLCEKNPQL